MTITAEACQLEIRADSCPVCGDFKPSGKLFDAKCWTALTDAQRAKCFLRFGEGFEDAYERAKTHIRNARGWRQDVAKGPKSARDQGRFARFGYRPK